MPQLLNEKTALVTGAGRGIGVSIARALAGEGATVLLAYRASREGAEMVAREIRSEGGMAHLFQADLQRPEDCVRLIAQVTELGAGLDILVNNAAGFGAVRRFQETAWAEIDEEWNAVTKPVFLLTHAALPLFTAQKRGKIVNLTATLVHRAQAGYGAHTMAKAAVLAFTKTLAAEMGEFGVTVNAVSPGIAMTEFSHTLPDTVRASVARRTPLRRLAQPDDVARAVLFFCSPWSDFVTGAEIASDGGLAQL